jgi:outer membrane lipopolysaccharide assembly protein LptE/RlpB
MHSTSKVPLRFILPLFLVFSLVAGCGFQLRGTDANYSLEHLSPLYISGLGQTDPLFIMLRGQLAGSGVQVVANPAQAKELLHIYGRTAEKKTHSVTGRGKTLEYELTESLSFNLGGPPDAMAQAQNKPVTVRRVYVNPETETLARQTEETDLRRDMQQQLVGMLLQRLAAQARTKSRVTQE